MFLYSLYTGELTNEKLSSLFFSKFYKRVIALTIMKKGDLNDNSFGVAAVIMGILSVTFASIPGLVMGILAIIFASIQKKRFPNKWAKVGFTLGIIGVVLNVLVIYIVIKYSDVLLNLQNAAS